MKPKLSPIAAAAASTVISMELTEIERQAALKMPMKDAARDAAPILAKQVDDGLKKLLTLYFRVQQELGPWELALDDRLMELVQAKPDRLTLHPDPEDAELPDKPLGEVYAIDGVPLLWVGPVKIEYEGDPRDNTVRFARDTLVLYPPPTVDFGVGQAEPRGAVEAATAVRHIRP